MKLTHGQQVKIAGANWAQAITVGTVEGYAAQYKEDPVAMVKREMSRGHNLAWTNQEAACLSSDYPGKNAAMIAKKEAFGTAPWLVEGQAVEIEGRQYTVHINGVHYSDPVKFVPVV